MYQIKEVLDSASYKQYSDRAIRKAEMMRDLAGGLFFIFTAVISLVALVIFNHVSLGY